MGYAMTKAPIEQQQPPAPSTPAQVIDNVKRATPPPTPKRKLRWPRHAVYLSAPTVSIKRREPMPTKQWVFNVAKGMRAEGKFFSKRNAADKIATLMVDAAARGEVKKAIKGCSIRNMLIKF